MLTARKALDLLDLRFSAFANSKQFKAAIASCRRSPEPAVSTEQCPARVTGADIERFV